MDESLLHKCIYEHMHTHTLLGSERNQGYIPYHRAFLTPVM